MKTLYFDDYDELSLHFSDTFDTVKKNYDEVSLIAKYSEAKEIIRNLICYGYDIASIDLHLEESEQYWDEYLISMNHDGIWCEKFKRDRYGYFKVEDKATYISNECSSAVIPYIKSDFVVAFEISCDCEDCDGCDYCGTVGCKETPAEMVKNDVLLASTYRINGKEVDKATYETKEKEFLKEYAEMMDEFNNRLAALNEVDRLIHNAFRLF